MGKGTITADNENGSYSATLIYAGRDRVESEIANLSTTRDELEIQIAAMPEGLTKDIAELRLASLNKRINYLQSKMPDDRPIPLIWCADYTTGLTGDVGIIEVPGERTDGVNIQPGYGANAVYDTNRDGQLLPSVATSPEAAYFNRAILPGWQRWKPTYRYGTIITDSIDYDNNTCDICLDPAYSSQQNLDINQNQGFSECEIAPPQGFTQFCTDNPTHPTCTNTEPPGAFFISDDQFENIKAVNQQVNSDHEYESDQSGYGIGEQWAIMGEGETGDCEDFALTKMQQLIDAGYSAKNLQIAVGETETGGEHAVLLIETSNRGTLILDNRYSTIMKIENVPYRFKAYQRAGTDWALYTTKLENVPIQYMDCNAIAFSDGDGVIVKFEDQSWLNPKVIGFISSPAECAQQIYKFAGYAYIPPEFWGDPLLEPRNASKYDPSSDTWSLLLALPGIINISGQSYDFPMILREHVAANFDDTGRYTWLMGGSHQDVYYVGIGACEDFNRYAITRNDQIDKFAAGVGTEKTDVPFSASYSSGFYINGLNYLIGGANWPSAADACTESLPSSWPTYSYFYQFDDTLDAWTGLPDISTTLYAHGTFKINGKGFRIGGGTANYYSDWENTNNNFTGVVKSFDPVTAVWTSRSAIDRDRASCACGSIPSTDKGYALGGAWFDGAALQYQEKTMQEFDDVQDAWTEKQEAPYYETFSYASGVGAIQGFYSILSQYDYSALTWFWNYDPSGDIWAARENFSDGAVQGGVELTT